MNQEITDWEMREARRWIVPMGDLTVKNEFDDSLIKYLEMDLRSLLEEQNDVIWERDWCMRENKWEK